MQYSLLSTVYCSRKICALPWSDRRNRRSVLSISDIVHLAEEEEARHCACGASISHARARTCASCSRASSHRHYERNRSRVLAGYHAKKKLFTPAQLQERRDRAYLAQYVKRGKVVPDACRRCGDPNVVPIQPELGRPLVVVWACRSCKPRVAADLQGDVIWPAPPIRQPRREQAAARARPSAETFEAVERELQTWPPQAAEALRRAASTVRGVPLSRESPLYRMMLVTLYKRARAAGGMPP
jgi:hypothetical protein